MLRRLEILLAACLYYSRLVLLVRWWKEHFAPSLVILNYHQATGGDLRSHLLYLRRHYRILHLEQALEELYLPYNSRTKGMRDRRTPLVLTFDDGYYDNYTHAFKLACELQVPITIFLIPGYIESGNRFWWLAGEYLAAHAQEARATLEGRTYTLERSDERKALAHAIDTRVRYATSVAEREAFLAEVAQTLRVAAGATAEERLALPLTWKEIRAMEESGWISFGAHTMHHPILACLTDPTEVQYEVQSSRAVLEERLGHPVRTFAYPVGRLHDIGEHGVEAVRKAAFDWAVTTVHGFNTARSDPYLLRRVEVDVNQHWLQIAVKTCGLWTFLSSLFWRLIAPLRKSAK